MRYFIRTFVLGLGFFSGLWIGVGVNPETEIVKAFSDLANSLLAGSGILFWAISVIATILSILGAFTTGGWLGLLAVGLAFIGGILFVFYPIPAVVCIGLGVFFGIFASSDTE